MYLLLRCRLEERAVMAVEPDQVHCTRHALHHLRQPPGIIEAVVDSAKHHILDRQRVAPPPLVVLLKLGPEGAH
jgi:hypothetical protein